MKYKVGDTVRYGRTITKIKKVNRNTYALEKHTASGCNCYFERELTLIKKAE